MHGHQGAGGGTLFLGAHGIGVERRDCREHPTHARRGDEEGQPEQRRRVGEAHGGETDGGDQPADPDQSRRWPVQAAHQELGQDQRDAHGGQGDAGHPRGVGGIQAQPVEGEEAHGDLRHGDAEHRHEAHRQRPPQAAVADRQGGAAVRLATLLARQPAPERQQGDQGQRAGDQQRQDQPVSRQQSGQPRPDHHAYRAGRAESGQRAARRCAST